MIVTELTSVLRRCSQAVGQVFVCGPDDIVRMHSYLAHMQYTTVSVCVCVCVCAITAAVTGRWFVGWWLRRGHFPSHSAWGVCGIGSWTGSWGALWLVTCQSMRSATQSQPLSLGYGSILAAVLWH